MTTSDMERLLALVKGYRLQGRDDGNLDVLEEELDRALVMDAGRRLPSDVVTLDTRVLVIFDPYWRAHNATYKGTGLGLAIVRGIVEGHGGRVWFESEPGHGAAFLFGIPAA